MGQCRPATLLLFSLLVALAGCAGTSGSLPADDPPPSIVAQPANQTVAAAQPATFSVIVTGTEPFKYQWLKNGTAISGAIAGSYTTPPTTSADDGAQFAVFVSNGAGTATSSAATLTVNLPPSISSQPVSQAVNLGQTATFSVTSTGTAPLTYQWKRNGVNLTGATTSTYTIPAATASDSAAQFTVTIGNSAGSITSNTAVLTVNIPPSIAVQPANHTVIVGQATTFSVIATGTAPISYQWQRNGAYIPGATTSSYTIPTTAPPDNGALFNVMISNTAGAVISNNAILTVNVPPLITVPPIGQTVVTGQAASFSVTATGTAPLTYQWTKNGANIPGATTSGYTTPVTSSSDDGSQFAVIVTNIAGTATSNPASLTVNAPPSIVTQPVSRTVIAGQAATFSVSGTGTNPLTYQWTRNGANIPGATTSSYTTPATTGSDDGSQFEVIVANVAGTITSSAATLTVHIPPSVTAQPLSQTVTAGQTATFSVSATGTEPLSYQWQVNGMAISGATSETYTTPSTANADSGSQVSVAVSNVAGSARSEAATLTVNPPQPIDVVTYHNDIGRTGQNLSETILTRSNVNASSFGKVGFFPVDGQVYGQPLYLSSVTIPGQGTHDVLYVVTEHDSVYAFDAVTGAQLWQASVLGAGETPSDPRNCAEITPEIGITATPVIDRMRGPNGAIYVVAMSMDGSGNYFQRIHALDITTGAELFGGPTTIQASYPGTGDNSDGVNVIFDPKYYKERTALLSLNGKIYTAWAGICDTRPYTGWVMAFDAQTLAMTSVLNITPNGSDGGIWQSGGGLAADSNGNVYFLAGNGTFETTLDANGFPNLGDFGNSFLKLSTSNGLAVADYFAPYDTISESFYDGDLGSGGAMLLPDIVDNSGQVWHLALGAGKNGVICVVNRDAMGKFYSDFDHIYQVIRGVLQADNFSTPVYFNNTVYFGSEKSPIMAFGIDNAQLTVPPAGQTDNSFGYPGTTPGISANGTGDAILWALENSNTNAILHAYDATNLSNELYNSDQAPGGRDQFGPGVKFVTPTVANGRAYVGAATGVAVFGVK